MTHVTQPTRHNPLQEASDRLVRTVDGLTDEQLAGPSLLPGWSRAHVVAHLALNAEGLARALEGVVQGDPAPVYDSGEARDRDIDDLSARASTELRERLMAAVTRLAEAVEHLTPEQQATGIERVPGGPVWRAGDAAAKRWVEVEVHHADLDAGYGCGDWPQEFSEHLLGNFAQRPPHWEPAFVADPDGLDGTWSLGTTDDRSPVVSGPAGALAWWVTGRGDGSGLTSTTGALPTIGRW